MSLLRSIRRGALLGALLAPAVAAAQRDDRDRDRDGRSVNSQIDTAFAFDARGTVELRLLSGEIVVGRGSGGRVQVRATSERGYLRLNGTSSRITLSTETANGRIGRTRYELLVPEGVRVIANTTSASVEVRGTNGDVQVETTSGDITVSDARSRAVLETVSGDVSLTTVEGNARISSVSGDLRGEAITGDLEAETTSGDIVLIGVQSGFVRAETTSGDIRFGGRVSEAGRYEFRSHSGDVDLGLPSDVRAQLTVATWSGDLDSAFPITIQPGEIGSGGGRAKRFTFNVNGGGARIMAETFSGDVILRRR